MEDNIRMVENGGFWLEDRPHRVKFPVLLKKMRR